VRQIADAMVSSGLSAAGYKYLTVDDCWSALNRDGNGNLTHHTTKFPSGMKALGDYVHAKGLKYGIYLSIGSLTCTGKTPGSLNNEFRDIATIASWGADYTKVDRCGPERDSLDLPTIYARYRDAIAAAGRPIVHSASDNAGRQEPWAWGPAVAHQWRTTGDIRDEWLRMLGMFDGNSRHPGSSVPGGVNDPDMLEVGNGAMTDAEYRTHMALWAVSSAPLIAGNDVRSMSAATKAILTHEEVIAIDQDPLVFQGIKVSDNGAGLQVWYKPIAGAGARAVALTNRSAATATMNVSWTQIGLRAGSATVRDIWARANRGTFTNSYSVSVASHATVFVKVVGNDPQLLTGQLSDQTWSFAANNSGPVERDRSTNTSAGGDGNPITLNGTVHSKGLGVHAPAAVEFRAGGVCTNFSAQVGVDDEVGSAGSVVFSVYGDGVKLYDSGVMTGSSATRNVSVDITGRTSLRLQVGSGSDLTTSDHADWANARVTCGTETPGPTPTPTATPIPTVTPTPCTGCAFVEITPPGSAVTASTNDGNLPGNTVDNDLATRWSGNGDGAWLQLDLGIEQTVAKVHVAVYNGNGRRNRFDLQVSTGGGVWTTVWSGESSGTTTSEEAYDFDDQPARWVRYLGHASNVGTFNSVTEVSVFAPGGATEPTPTPTPTDAPTITPTPTATPTPTVTPTPGGFSGYYRVTARHSGKAMVVQSASTVDGANVFQWTYGGATTNDEWEIRAIAGGFYRVINRHSGKDLTVQSASTAEGANIFQWTYGGAATNDEWSIVDVGGGFHRLTSRHSGKSAEVLAAGTADGADIVQRTYAGAAHQQFEIVSVP
jgi:alpha-galactosidase